MWDGETRQEQEVARLLPGGGHGTELLRTDDGTSQTQPLRTGCVPERQAPTDAHTSTPGGDTFCSILQMEKLSLRKPLDNLPTATQQVRRRVRTRTQASCIPSASSDRPLLDHHQPARRSAPKAPGPSLLNGFTR